ncbi:hypothetical protein [Foetidibacter luteolus]|uniref:hypothetical protein n=1 Tax=Foetidibacter luteolus TaxID=2608880 RepID=UPI00129B777C|nr:hypothetical protein [Foetidibacter luteolus]
MKKATFIILAAVLSLAGYSQTVYNINPVGEEKNNKTSVRFGETVKFRIKNVNSLKLGGYVTSKPITIDFTIPTQFSEAGQQETAGKEDAEKKTSGISKNAVSAWADTKLLEEQKKAAINEAEGVRQEEDSLVQKINELAKKSNKQSSAITALQKKLNTVIEAIDAINKKIEQLTKAIEQQQKEKKEDSLRQVFKKEFSAFIADIQKISLYVKAEEHIDSMVPPLFIADTAALKRSVKNYIDAVFGSPDDSACAKEVIDVFNRVNSSYTILKETYETLSKLVDNENSTVSGELKTKGGEISIKITDAKLEFKRKKFFEEEFAFASKLQKELSEPKTRTELINKANLAVNLYTLICNSHFEVYTDAEQINDDFMELSPVLKDSNGKTVKEFNKVTFRSQGGIKVNFSSGYLMSFAGDDNYAIYTDGDTVLGVKKQATNKITHAIGALGHVYVRSDKDVNVALSGGISITNTGTVGFYFGPSLLFLEKNRLAFSAGISFIQTKTLNTGNLKPIPDSDNGPYQFAFSNTGNNTINYDNLYKSHFFIGLTYNIFKSK